MSSETVQLLTQWGNERNSCLIQGGKCCIKRVVKGEQKQLPLVEVSDRRLVITVNSKQHGVDTESHEEGGGGQKGARTQPPLVNYLEIEVGQLCEEEARQLGTRRDTNF